MAVVRTGSIVADIRGSIGEETYSRNQGGLYVKSRTGPTTEPTAKQTTVKNAMTAISRYWSTTLTAAQRSDWRKYAAQFPQTNQWGTKSLQNGYCRFVATNMPFRILTGGILAANAPRIAPFPTPLFTFTCSAATGNLTINMPTLYNPPTGSYSGMLYYIGNQVAGGVNFYAGPFTQFATNLWAYTAWIENPKIISTGQACTQGKKFWLRARLFDSTNGQQSSIAVASTVIGA